MPSYPPAFMRVVEELSRLPGLGSKTAQRLAFFMLKSSPQSAKALAQSLESLHAQVKTCRVCFNLSETELCPICADPTRLAQVICVVEEPNDLGAIERTGEFRGLYHVLLGSLSPLEGIGPDELKIKELLARLTKGGVDEVIAATNHSVEGEATALYLARLIKPLGVKLTRLASGLPMGADLEYADQVTVARAMAGRREI
ncbi:MAG: recombination mediator RecR [candidate division FCPU426 bacterium]